MKLNNDEIKAITYKVASILKERRDNYMSNRLTIEEFLKSIKTTPRYVAFKKIKTAIEKYNTEHEHPSACQSGISDYYFRSYEAALYDEYKSDYNKNAPVAVDEGKIKHEVILTNLSTSTEDADIQIMINNIISKFS